MGGILVIGNTMHPVKEERQRNGKTVMRHEGNTLNFMFANVRQHPRQGKEGDITLQRCNYFPGVMKQMLPLHLNLCFKPRPKPVQP